MKSKGRPKGPQKVVFKRRVLATTVPKLDALIKELESLVHAASTKLPTIPGSTSGDAGPAFRGFPEPLKPRNFVGPGKLSLDKWGKAIPTPTPKVETPLKAKERPPLVLPEGVRPNFFKKP